MKSKRGEPENPPSPPPPRALWIGCAILCYAILSYAILCNSLPGYPSCPLESPNKVIRLSSVGGRKATKVEKNENKVFKEDPGKTLF